VHASGAFAEGVQLQLQGNSAQSDNCNACSDWRLEFRVDGYEIGWNGNVLSLAENCY